jgi:dipeptidyl aminopeptidase/acylaminoacyl peptidase
MRLFAAAGLALALLVSTTAQARPFTARDLASQDRVSDPNISSDGRWVAYSVRSTDWEGNKGVNALWVLDRKTAGAKPVQVLKDEKAPAAPSWSADGRWLYVLSSTSGTRQVWRMAADGSGRAQITSLPVDVGFYRLSADGRVLVVGLDVYPDCADLACTRARAEAAEKVKASGKSFADGVIPRTFDHYEDELFTGLYSVRLDGVGAPAEATPLTPGLKTDADGDQLAISRDGKLVWFAATPAGVSSGTGAIASLYTVPGDGSAAPARLSPASVASDSRPVLSPDGKTLAYVAEVAPVMIAQRSALMIRDLKTGATREVAPDLDISANALAWSPDGKALYVTSQSMGQVKLFAVNIADGKVATVVGDGTVAAFDLASGVTVYQRESLTSPGQLYEIAGGGAPRQLTTIAAEALSDTPMSEAEQFSFAGWNGETVHGYVVKPAGWEAGKTYPVAFLIHGGPHGSFGNAWSYRWNPQVWAGMGYAVVMIDFHGSTGYGTAFAQSIVGHWGDRPLEDLQKGWAAALGKYTWLDADRACALGGSYGGYMVDWIASQWQTPWKCLVNHAGLFDTRSMAYATDIPNFSEEQYGVPWSDPVAVDRFNPAVHVKAWKTPMLVIHGSRDYRVPLDQGIASYTANQRLGVPSQFLNFPDENHWVLKPQNSVQWYGAVEAWMDRWTAETPPAP